MSATSDNAAKQKQEPAEIGQARDCVLIVEPDAAVRETLTRVIDGEADLHVCAAVGTCEEAVPLVRKLHPDLVLVDDSESGKKTLQSLQKLHTHSRNTKLLVLSMKHAAAYASQVLQAGADGYLTTDDMDQVTDAIRDVLAGFLFVSEAVAGCPELAGGARLMPGAGPKQARNGRMVPA